MTTTVQTQERGEADRDAATWLRADRPSLAVRLAGAAARFRNLDTDRLSLAAAILLGIVFGMAQILGKLAAPIDFDSYWRASLAHLYVASWDDPALTYLYPPPMAQLLAPLHVMPLAFATVAWTTICFACLWYCLREWTLPVGAAGLAAFLLPNDNLLASVLSGPISAVLLGNVNIVIAAAIVAAFRRPEWWAISAVLKVGTGIGIVWHPARGEWRGFIRAVGLLALIGAASFALAPSLWVDWTSFAIHNQQGSRLVPVVGPPLWTRVLAAIALTVYAARADRAWLVPIACAIANPAIYSARTLTAVGCGAVALWTRRPASQRADGRLGWLRGYGRPVALGNPAGAVEQRDATGVGPDLAGHLLRAGEQPVDL